MSDDSITLAHGGGGGVAADFLEAEILSRFGDGALSGLPDAASATVGGAEILFSTDSHVVQPLFFPGGDIGALSVHGTVNDICVAGGRPKLISLALIMEDGLPMEIVGRILDSVAEAAKNCGVAVATGDTKVVGKGQCDKIYINTAGIGERIREFNLAKSRIEPGDAVLVSGTIGEHGMAVLAAREGLPLENGPESDSAPVLGLMETAAAFGDAVKFARDPTRGGVAAVTNEMVAGTNSGVGLEEAAIPVSKATAGVAEMLGLDVLNVACEGRVVLVCDADSAVPLLEAWKRLPEGANSAVVGKITDNAGVVALDTSAGGVRLVLPPAGELLPRIC